MIKYWIVFLFVVSHVIANAHVVIPSTMEIQQKVCAKEGKVSSIPGDTIKVLTKAQTGFICVESESIIDRVEVVRLDGSLIHDTISNQTKIKLDMRLEPEGIYMVRFHHKNKQKTLKFVLS